MSGTIYHGTPLTPRDALLSVCEGRAMCVSFFRPDDVEAVEAISPAIMFRQRSLFGMAGGAKARRGMVHPAGLDAILRVAGAETISTGAVGGDPRCAGRAEPAQRQPYSAMAVRGTGRAPVAYGWANRAAVATVREVSPRVPRMDWCGQASRQPGVSRADGRSIPRTRQPLAASAHDARDRGRANVPVRQRGRNLTRTEWMAL